MKTSEILTIAKGYIEKGFTKDAWAKTADGRDTGGQSENAVCWCTEGAVIRAVFLNNGSSTHNPFDALQETIPEDFERDTDCAPIPQYNDAPATTQQDVLAWFDRAIAYAKEKLDEDV